MNNLIVIISSYWGAHITCKIWRPQLQIIVQFLLQLTRKKISTFNFALIFALT